MTRRCFEGAVSFAAERYDAEVARVVADHSWETSDRTAARLILSDVDRKALAAHGLAPSWVVNDWASPELLRVCLQRKDGGQLFALFPWRGRGPQELADEVCRTLKQPPGRWPTA